MDAARARGRGRLRPWGWTSRGPGTTPRVYDLNVARAGETGVPAVAGRPQRRLRAQVHNRRAPWF